MNLEETIRALLGGGKLEMRRAARDLAHELPRRNLDKLRAFRSALAEVRPTEAHHLGFIDALLEVTAAYEAASGRPVVDNVSCNRCGKQIDTGAEDYIRVSEHWGYYSRKDGEHHRWNLCEDCYDEVVSTFKVPP